MRRFLQIVLFTYFAGTVVAGVILTELTVRPPHRPILEKVEAIAVSVRHHAPLRDVEITSAEGVPLRAWVMKPNGGHSDAVMLLHGIADNRVGMLGYAEIFLSRGYTVLLPDARAHGSSAG